MFIHLLLMKQFRLMLDLRKGNRVVPLRSGLIVAVALICFVALPVFAQQADSNEAPVVVQPGAPGQPTRMLPPTTRATLPPRSPKDVEFMQGMIMHHAQAVVMTALMEARSKNRKLLLLGARISHTQSDEINFMRRWLKTRGERLSMSMPEKKKMKMPDMDMSKHKMSGDHMMPGMLTQKQMKALENANGTEFDRLFLKGMIQHHIGALIMVKDLFDTSGAGQDAEMFNFATDVDSGQRAEIRLMQAMLDENTQEEK